MPSALSAPTSIRRSARRRYDIRRADTFEQQALAAHAAEERARRKKTLEETALDVERARRAARKIVDAEERPPRPPIRALSVAELLERPTPDYLIDQLLPEGAFAELVGDSESLKSFLSIHFGLSIASGRPDVFGLRIVRHGPVLYIAAEGAGAFQFRLRAWGDEHDIDITKVPFFTIAAPINLRDLLFQAELERIVGEVQPVLIVVDTLHRCLPGADENSARDLGEVVGFATRLQAQSGCCLLFLHHPPKSDPAGRGRGSGALYYAADTELNSMIEGAEQPDGTKIVTVSVKKQKDDAKLSSRSRTSSCPCVTPSAGRWPTHPGAALRAACSAWRPPPTSRPPAGRRRAECVTASSRSSARTPGRRKSISATR